MTEPAEQTQPRRGPVARGKELIRIGQFEGTATQLIKEYQGNLSRVMPRHVGAEAFTGLAVAYVANDAKLHDAATANPASLIVALRECAALGHMPVKDTFALVPYNDKNSPGGKRVVGIETYHGVVERMFRAGGVQAVTAEVVRENDRYVRGRTSTTPPEHEFDDFAHGPDSAGPLRGVYAYAVLLNGATSHVVRMGLEDIAKHRAKSRSGEAFWGPEWPKEGPWTPAMWMKTALHALEVWVPTSSEYRWQVAASQSAASGPWPGVPPGVPGSEGGAPAVSGDIEDAEIVETGESS